MRKARGHKLQEVIQTVGLRTENAILESCQSSVASCLTIVTGQRIAESLVDTFVNQNAHLGTRE